MHSYLPPMGHSNWVWRSPFGALVGKGLEFLSGLIAEATESKLVVEMITKHLIRSFTPNKAMHMLLIIISFTLQSISSRYLGVMRQSLLLCSSILYSMMRALRK